MRQNDKDYSRYLKEHEQYSFISSMKHVYPLRLNQEGMVDKISFELNYKW